MRLTAALCAGILWAAGAGAQTAEQPILENNGKPMTVGYQCAEEDIRMGGLSCTAEDPCPVFLELASVEAVGNRIFAAGNIHSSSTTLYSVLLASNDAGKTWQEPFARIRMAGFDRIQFIDFEKGWVAGEMQHPLPHDPFLLVTSDGGKAWQQQTIFTEPEFGSILQFWFSSRTSGRLVIDRGRAAEAGRYELFETSDGGETWMPRQTNQQPIQIKPASAANGDWRLRADAASKSYDIERRAGEGWRRVAAFSVGLGVCRPAELPAAPAEPLVGPQ